MSLLYPRMCERPPEFRINQLSALYPGLRASYLGQNPGTTFYQDATLDFGRGNNGTLAGYTGAGDTPAAMWGRALGRPVLGNDGSNDYVTASRPAGITSAGPWSIAQWVRLVATGNNWVFCCRDSGDVAGIYWLDDNSGYEFGRVGSAAGDRKWVASSTVAAAWHHFLFTYSGSAAALWVDGNSVTATGTYMGGFGTGQNLLRIGGNSAGSYPLAMQTADTMLWSRVLGAAEVTALANPGNVDLRVGGVPLILPLRQRVYGAAVAAGDGGFKAAWARRQRQIITGGVA